MKIVVNSARDGQGCGECHERDPGTPEGGACGPALCLLK